MRRSLPMTSFRRRTPHRAVGPHWLAVALLPLIVSLTPLRADDDEKTKAQIASEQAKLLAGQYEDVIADTEKQGDGSPEWRRLKAEALTALGRYPEALTYLTKSLEHYPLDLHLKLALFEATRRAGQAEQAKAILDALDRLGGTREWAYREPADRIALGRVALLIGADPKRALDLFFEPTRKEHPEFPGSYLASGELALQKSDYALASRTFGTATRKFPENAEAWYGLARAFAPSDSRESAAALGKVFALNPRHVGAHLLAAEQHIDAEDYPEAEKAIAEALKTNPNSPPAHALRAVLANLRNDPASEKTGRQKALAAWPKNPEVPHLIGRKLSQKYRFAEGAALQREALEFDPAFTPAKAQLANDLLRLGDDTEGWRLAEEVQTSDPYDVVAYNLTTLHDAISKFEVLQSEHFTVRMDPQEAAIYGPKVLALLERAHSTLTQKYGLNLDRKTIVEIFPDQKDFAIRTFGLPGGAGYLGVCFGRVITANSAAARPGSNASWEAILWHEFCHVVTLTLTKNKMPRWLSEGISVFEERQQRGNWGEQMKPRYRAMILGEDFTPVSQLSGAFLRPKSAVHLGFAYYESSLVVEWLVQRWGLEKMKSLLADLAHGSEINAALAANFAPIDQLDREFAEHAQTLAKAVGPQLDWKSIPPRELSSPAATAKVLAENPTSYEALLAQAQFLLRARKWAEAEVPLQKLLDLYPEQHDADGPYAMLARIQRELGETDAEVATLTRLTELTPEATDAFLRLMEIHATRQKWPQVLDFAQRYQAVDPLRPEPHRFEAEAREASGQHKVAIAAWQTLLKTNTGDLPEAHYRLARLLHAAGDAEARKHILLALEETPRYRAALDLLLQMTPPKP